MYILNKKIIFKNDLFFILLLILFFSWFGIALFRTSYNFSKIVTEENNWYLLSDEDKRIKQFGDLHYLLRFVQKNTNKESQILFFTNDLKAYYLGRYYLYPRKIIAESEKLIWNPKADYYDYILIFPVTDDLKIKALKESNIISYKKFEVYKTPSGEVAELYKK